MSTNNLWLPGKLYSLQIIEAKGKTGGYRVRVTFIQKGGKINEATHTYLFKDRIDAQQLIKSVRGRTFINLDHWVFTAHTDNFITELRKPCTARYKTQLFTLPSF